MTDTVPTTPAPSRKKLLIGTAAAVGVAAVALVGFVLPAEFGIDPTGLGKAFGVTKLSGEGEENIYLERGRKRTNVLFPLDAAATPDEATLRQLLTEKGIAFPAGATVQADRFQIELLPYEGTELKYVLEQGAPMVFAWSATGPVNIDMHSHPFDGGTEATESFVIDDLQNQTGVYVAPFTGIHGWYWQNRTMSPITLTLDTTGAMTASKIFDPAGEHDRALTPPTASPTPEPTAPAP